jgi:hypothetical protein
MHEALQGATFHVDHIQPQSQGGGSDLDNLAWTCPRCNLKKQDRCQAVDPDTGAVVPLFHPRRDRWEDHFCFQQYFLIGNSATGRATAALLDLNHSRRLLIRQAEEMFGLFPPSSTGS